MRTESQTEALLQWFSRAGFEYDGRRVAREGNPIRFL